MPGGTGRLLRAARARAGMSQRELARRADLPSTVLCAYENGRREPSARVFRALLRAAGAELTLNARWDSERNARAFEHVMEMTDHLPHRSRGALTFPTMNGFPRG